MAMVPATRFYMGTDRAAISTLLTKFNVRREDIFSAEVPRHEVQVDSFYIDKHEVTNGEFKKFVDKNPEWQKKNIAIGLTNGKYLSDWDGSEFPRSKRDFPVIFITWYAAEAYCRWVGGRLPTEAEWDLAARGGLSGKVFPWGDEPADKSRANFSASSIGAATKVGRYSPNGYGLFDMAGNVWEFTADEWANYPTTSILLDNPIAGGDLFDKGDSYLRVTSRRVIRGGSWGASPINLRVDYRDSHPPNGAGDHVGFRCMMPAKTP